MKNPILLIIVVTLLGLSSCKKVKVSAASMSNEDAANVIGSSLASGSSGVTTTQSDLALSSQTLYTQSATACGITKVDSISHQSMAGAASTYSYKAKFTSFLSCNTKNLPDNVTTTLSYVGSFNGPKVIYNNNGTGSFTVGGLTAASTIYSINGTYHSGGNFLLKSDTTKNGSVTLDFALKSLTVTKATAAVPNGITGGTATVNISGNNPKRGSFSFDGTLTFSGSALAVLTLNGTVYFVNLLTGNVVKQ